VTEKEEEILRSEEGFWNTGLLLFERLQRSLNFARSTSTVENKIQEQRYTQRQRERYKKQQKRERYKRYAISMGRVAT
jgi:hypothetical protein